MKRLPNLTMLLGALFALLSAGTVMAQAHPVSGVVVSETENQPLPNVNVIAEGTTVGTITDANGKFTLNLPAGKKIIIVSFSGYVSQRIDVGNQPTVAVRLGVDNKQLSEVVVTSLGIKRQARSLGYSVQSVDGSSLTEARETNVLNSLKGKVAGVHINPSAGPAGSSYISIRGNTSLAGRNQPLFVVDGIPINNDNLDQASQFGGRDYGDGIKDINPDDIESISILKGPSAATLYGVRGGNGAVLITTKKGSKKGLGIFVNSNATFETPNSIPKHQNVWAAGYDGDFGQWGKTIIEGQQYYQHPTWLIDNWGPKMDGQLITFQTLPDLGLVPLSPQPEDNIKDFYQTGSTFSNTVALTSVSDKINFRLSLGDTRNTGIIPHNGFNRQMINTIVGANITDKLSVEVKVNYIRQVTDNRPDVGGSSRNPGSSLNVLPRYVNLDWLKEYKNPDGSHRNWKGGNASWDVLNPNWITNELLNNDRRDRFIGAVSINYALTPWLNLKGRSGQDVYTDVRNARNGQGTPDEQGMGGYVSNIQHHVKESNSDVLLSASGSLSSNFTGSLNAGANHFEKRAESIGISGRNLIVDGLYVVSNTSNQFTSNDLYREVINSVYFSGQLGYKNYLFLDISGRNDWSSTLSQGNYSFFYPAVSLSHVLTDVIKVSPSILSYAKLRASYAQAGTTGPAYQTKAGYYLNPLPGYNGLPYAGINLDIPSKLKNELNTSWEFGTDLRFFNNRVALDFTYYSSSVTDQIIGLQLPAATGFNSIIVNSGEIQNKGLEVFASAKILQSKKLFNWEVSVNLSHNKSKVISLYPGIETQFLLDDGEVSIQARPGEPFGNIVGYDYKKNADGVKILDQNGIAQRASQKTILGNVQPKFLAGVTNTFSIDGVSLSFLIDVREGGTIYSRTFYDGMAKGTGKFTENGDNLVQDGVIDDGSGNFVKSTKVLNRQQYYAQSSVWNGVRSPMMLSASYAALREVTLGYEFHKTFLSRIGVNGAKVSVVGRNLLYLYRDEMFKTMGISPEGAYAPTAVAQGVESFSIPSTRSIGINLSFNF